MATAKLLIEPDKFDMAVWNTQSDFSTNEYNSWLRTASGTLQRIYDVLADGEIIDSSDLYLLGDVINILDTIKIAKQK